jgi:hypothetical protein
MCAIRDRGGALPDFAAIRRHDFAAIRHEDGGA